MNRLFPFFLCIMSYSSFAQENNTKFYLAITDKTQIQSITSNIDGNGNITYSISFSDANVTAIFSNYVVYNFSEAFPDSRFRYMREKWFVSCSTDSLALDLINYDNNLFPYYEILPELTPLSCYSVSCSSRPNDPGIGSAGDYDCEQPWLPFINAEEAWCVTTGNPNTLIGILDFGHLKSNHVELNGQIHSILHNASTSDPSDHGTAVVGMAVGKTNNSNYYASIGYNCRAIYGLALNPVGGDAEFRKMVNSGAKIINGSFAGSIQGSSTNNPIPFDPGINTYSKNAQKFYHELYEMGVSNVFAAGNGCERNYDGTQITAFPWDYQIPASLDHVISVSSVGWENPTGGSNPDHQKYIHDWVVGGSTNCVTGSGYVNNSHTHNNRVDICAPGIKLSALLYDHNTPTVDKVNRWGQWGTSFSSPIVAGTIGLMLSVNPFLSPYQREVILKRNAIDIYNSVNFPQNGDYIGYLGAGMLDAGASVSDANTFNCNDQATRTMIIKGPEINTRCWLGYSSPAVTPEFNNLVIENGTPPYTYRWMPLTDNWVTLSSTTVANPQVTAVNGKMHYLLTVYDNSSIPKVATRDIEVEFKTNATLGADIAIRDALADHYQEPNNMQEIDFNNWNYWSSPDIWNRINHDDQTTHQNIYYSSGTATPTNTMYARVRNVGCTTSGANDYKLHLYYRHVGALHQWSTAAWTEVTPSNGTAIPALDPGEEAIIGIDYTAPSPQSYGVTSFASRYNLHFCMVGRVTPLPFGISETQDLKDNVKKTNNIAMRNMTPVAVYPEHGIKNESKLSSYISGGYGGTHTYTIELLNDQSINKHLSGDMTQLLSFTLELGDLYDIWDAGGRLGKYTSYDEVNKTVTFDGGVDSLRLENIELDSDDIYTIGIIINTNATNYTEEIPNIEYHLRQILDSEVVGNVDIMVNILDTSNYDTVGYKQNLTISKGNSSPEHSYRIYPNPVHDIVNIRVNNYDIASANISIIDVMGKEIIREDNISIKKSDVHPISLSNIAAGVYFVTISDNLGKHQTLRIIKIE